MSRRRLLGLLPTIALITLAFTVSVDAAFPIVTHHKPLGGTRGQEITVTFTGDNLAEVHQVLTHQAGLDVVSVKSVDKKNAEVTFKTAAELQPGLYPVQLVSAYGVSNIRMIGIGALPTVMEAEPNSDFSTPQVIPLNHTVDGVIDREDVDYYSVDLKKGQRCTVEVEGIRVGYDLRNRYILDPFVAILNQERFELAASDDSSLLKQDGLCSYTAKEDESVIVMIRESAFRGQKNICGYRLHIGTFPRPIAVLPSGGVVGNVLEAKLFDVDGSTSSATVELPDEPVEYWPVTTQTPQGISPSPNWVRVSEYPVVMEAEPNNDYRKGQAVAVPALLCGVINQANDFDCFTFDAKKGQQLRVTVHARQKLRSPLDPVLNVFGPDNKTIKSSDDIGYNRDGTVDVSVKADGPHTIRVYDHLRGGSDLHHYVVSVEPITPGFKIDLKEVRRDEAVTVPVPAGGRGAMVVRVQRDRFNEEINFEVDDLPEGVTAQTFPMPKGRVEIPILLAAAADAQLEGKLFNVRGIGVAGSTEVNGDLKQHHKLVLGQNRRELFGYEADRAALAVVKPMPFEMEFVQPKTPILRRGSKELVVRVDRKDFTGRIYFKTLYYPPGVGVNNSKRLEADQTEVTIPITANKNAAIGNWPLILQVSYGTSGGTTTVASPPIDLAVEDAAFNLTFPRIAGEQGTSISLTVGIDAIRDVAGEVTMTLVGLPNGVSSPQPTQPVAKGAESVTFPLVIDPKAKTGRHKTLNVQTRIVRGGETMVQTDGTGEIRIDQPLPAKKQPEKKAAPKKVDPKKPATKKPLSRLEQLRQLKEAS